MSRCRRRRQYDDRDYTKSGAAPTAPSWTVDADAGVGTPLNEAEAEALLSDAGVASPNVTNLWRFGVPASGDVLDVIGGKTLTASVGGGNAWVYQQSETGWALPFLKCGAVGQAKLINSAMPDVSANSYTVFVLVKFAGSLDGNFRSIFALGTAFEDDASVCVSVDPELRCGEGDGTYTPGTTDPTGVVRYQVLRVDDTANTVDVFNEQEKIIVGSQACAGGVIKFGGDFLDSWRPPAMSLGLAFIHQGALTNAEIKAALTTLGESPGWTP